MTSGEQYISFPIVSHIFVFQKFIKACFKCFVVGDETI